MKNLLFLLVLLYHSAVSQERNAIRSIVTESQLTNEELRFANEVIADGFVNELWYAEVEMDPEASQMILNLPDGLSATWHNSIAKMHGSGIYTWRGRTEDGFGRANLAYNNGMITGGFSADHRRTYRIQPLSHNRHVIYRVNVPANMKEESREHYQMMSERKWVPSEERRAPKGNEDEDVAMKLTGNDCYIRILVGFDNVAGPSLADPIGFALSCIEQTNEIYAASEVNFEAELAYADIYPDAASEDIDDALAQWQYEIVEGFDNVFSDREQFDADFCILITENFDGDYVGLAATIGASYSSAFCVVEDGAAMDNFSFAHEIAHLMGARHDVYEDGSGDYNHGYIIHSEQVRTVMAYNTECDDNGYDCQRVGFFSNPDITYEATGKALGDASEAHNERALDENESDFADFEPVVTNKLFLFPETISGTIYGSITALSTIRNEASYEILNGAQGVWSAGDELTLDVGFEVESGSMFEGKIAGCNASRLGETGSAASLNASGASLLMNLFPDPASNETNVSFTIPDLSEVHGRLYDLSGRILLTFISSTCEAGPHQVKIDLDKIPSGTYLCKIDAGEVREVKKLVVQH